MVEDIDSGKFFEKTTSNKIYVNKLNLHENKNESLLRYTGDFDSNGLMLIGPVEHKTNISFENTDDFAISTINTANPQKYNKIP